MKEFNRKRYEMGWRIRKRRKRCDLWQEALVEKLGGVTGDGFPYRGRGYEDGCGNAGASVCHTTGDFKCDRWGNR